MLCDPLLGFSFQGLRGLRGSGVQGFRGFTTIRAFAQSAPSNTVYDLAVTRYFVAVLNLLMEIGSYEGRCRRPLG